MASWSQHLTWWKHDPTLRQRVWSLFAAALACCYSLSVLYYVITTPELGLRCAFAPVVNHFYESFRCPDDQPTLERGDRIVELGDQHIETWLQLLRQTALLNSTQPAIIDHLTLDDLRNHRVPDGQTFVQIGSERVVRVVYERRSEPGSRHVIWLRFGTAPVEAVLPSVLWFVLKMCLLLVGALILWRRPEDPTALQFFWLCIVTLLAYMGGYHWDRIVTQPLLLVVFMCSAILLPAVTLHFMLVFPRPRPFIERHNWLMLGIVYGPPLFFLLLLLQGYLRVRWLVQGGAIGLLSGIEHSMLTEGGDSTRSVSLLLLEILYEIYIYFGIAALWYLASLAALIQAYRSASTPLERNQVRWILLGAALAVVPIGYTLYLAVFEQGRFGGGAATWPMFAASASLTVAFTFSMTRYRLLQLDHVLSSGASYFLISFLAGLVYYAVVFVGLILVGSHVSEGPSIWQLLAVSTSALLLVAALDLVRGRILQVAQRHFRRERSQLERTLQRMSQTIDRLADPATLARQLLQGTTEVLSATGGSIYLRQGEPLLYRLVESRGIHPVATELASGFPLIEALSQQGCVGPEAAATPAGQQLLCLGGELAQALEHEGQLLGVLILAPRTEGSYTAEDRQVLAAFTRVLAVALVSAEGLRTIDTLHRELKAKVSAINTLQSRILALQRQLTSREQTALVADEPATASEQGQSSPHPVVPTTPAPGGLVGSSPQVQQLLHLVKRVAASSSAVLLRGESGTGKELLARALHESSPRANKPFIKVHCAALSPGLLESELFGHVKGAFTHAIRDKVGRFEAADGGTLFLDEIGDISLEVQTKLLRVLEEMTFERVGSIEPISVDVRIIAATHRNLEAMITEGKFREDLYFRLNVLPIHVPPLRERVEDIPELAAYFLNLYASRLGKAITGLDDEALAALKSYHWPGNIRQLENAIERAVIIAEGPVIGLAELPMEVKGAIALEEPDEADEQLLDLSLPELSAAIQAERRKRDQRERDQLMRALAAARGNKAEAARALGMARSTLLSRLKKLGLA
jgi:transcriptional regulator with GAF, ATPase, and Fis domain